ncbi:MAG: hypothetical protein KDH96_10220 [Candidatus Riesia sp.]|nr:hypothetical protein [Candidatus Riesia sp.]
MKKIKTNDKYILRNKKVVPVDDLLKWAEEFETQDRRVRLTKLPGGYRVSTVFLGIDHQWGDGPPLVFETMVFGPKGWGEMDMDRYSTWDEAVSGHKAMVERWKYPTIRKTINDITFFFEKIGWRIEALKRKLERRGNV